MFFEFQKSVKEHDELKTINRYSGLGRDSDPCTIRLLDDIGAHRTSEFGLEMFGLLLEKFYANGKTGLIFTSNLSPKQVLDVMGERISSRLRGLAQPIKVEGSDWRMENA
jgi:DNA replication protein DnaC